MPFVSMFTVLYGIRFTVGDHVGDGVRLLESVLSLESKKLLVLRLVARSRTSLKVRATPPQPHIHSESF